MHAGLSLNICNRRRVGPSAFALGGLAVSAAYGLRRLRSEQNGALMRARRSSDNAESDIEATASGWLDTATLLAWSGSSSVYVRTLYDQSGRGLHVTQATAASQPRLINAGVLETAPNGRPWMRCATNQFLRYDYTSGQLPAGGSAGTLACVANLGAGDGINIINGLSYGSGSGGSRRLLMLSTGFPRMTNGANNLSTGAVWANTLRSAVGVFSFATEMRLWVDGATVANSALSTPTNTLAASGLYIGNQDTASIPATFIAEAVVFGSALSTEQVARLRSNHQSVWGTP